MNACVDYKKLLIIAALVNILVIILLINLGQLTLGWNYETFTAAGTSGGVTWFLWGIFKKWLWKLPFLQHWLVKVPDLNGSWKGNLTSTWVNPQTQELLPPIETLVTIHQDLDKITLDFQTNEMESQSILANIQSDEHRRLTEIKYIYHSEPNATVRNRSEIHYGAAKLVAKKTSKSLILKGTYWTDRKTTGSIELRRSNS